MEILTKFHCGMRRRRTSRARKCQHILGNNLKHHAGSTSQLISSEAAEQRPAELKMLMESAWVTSVPRAGQRVRGTSSSESAPLLSPAWGAQIRLWAVHAASNADAGTLKRCDVNYFILLTSSMEAFNQCLEDKSPDWDGKAGLSRWFAENKGHFFQF